MFNQHVAAGEIPFILIGHGETRKHHRYEMTDLEQFKQSRKRWSAPTSSEPADGLASARIYDFAERLRKGLGPPPKPKPRGRK
jgi:hypothetical protein